MGPRLAFVVRTQLVALWARTRGGGNRGSSRRRTCGGVSLPHCGQPLGVHMTYNGWAAGWGGASRRKYWGVPVFWVWPVHAPIEEMLSRIPSEARSDVRTVGYGIGRPGIATRGRRDASVKGMDFQCGAKQAQKRRCQCVGNGLDAIVFSAKVSNPAAAEGSDTSLTIRWNVQHPRATSSGPVNDHDARVGGFPICRCRSSKRAQNY